MDNGKYLNKVTSQHKTKPKFMNWIDANLKSIDGITKLLKSLDYHFDVYTAKGKQQDIIGEIIGVSRVLDFQPMDGSSPVLDDEMYRVAQIAKISINQWDGTIPGIISLWKELFPDYRITIQDNQDMSIDFAIIGFASDLEKELVLRGFIVPEPEGVMIEYHFHTQLYQPEQEIYFTTTVDISHHYVIT